MARRGPTYGRVRRPPPAPPEPQRLHPDEEAAIRDRLRRYIREQFRTPYQVHRQLGVKLSTVNGWLRKKLPGLQALSPLVRHGLSLDWLTRGKGPMRYQPQPLGKSPEWGMRRFLRDALSRSEGRRFDEATWDALWRMRTRDGQAVPLVLAVDGVLPVYRELLAARADYVALRAEASALRDAGSREAVARFAEERFLNFQPNHPRVEFIGWQESGPSKEEK